MSATRGVRRPSRHNGAAIAARLVGAAALALLAACGNDNGATPATSSTSAQSTSSAKTTAASTSAPGTTSAFDPCTALTADFLAEHQWDARKPEPRQTNAGASTAKGCVYLARARYTFGVETTTTTLPQVREKFPTAADLTIGGRKALRYEARPDVPGGCTVNLEMKSGSLSILVDDPRGTHPRGLSPCDNAEEIAEAVAPLLPAGS
ncbi:DUF3558 domain-containing protein [Nocardia goodfellowii]|uniref:DUF3558 domain-containing protein n=1 Tax=Nocardia goodfellowii TaxID=882446 RepID=A0ABS4QIB0_9NOCA|nr:DUF3558 domain-containing protein [Nocardia goodfellowii]MBP2190895.1 hypothetical protein [Nocardia goodfellowii]